MRIRVVSVLLVLFLSLLMGTSVAHAHTTDSWPSGTFVGTGTYYSGTNFPFDMSINLSINGNQVSGTYTSDTYNTTVNISGTFDGSQITFTDPSYVSGNSIQLNCTYVMQWHLYVDQYIGQWYYPGDTSPDGNFELTLKT